MPSLGRLFLTEDYQGKTQNILLSHNLWQRRFSGDPSIIGRTIEVDRKIVTVIGIMPYGFDLPRGTEFWTTN